MPATYLISHVVTSPPRAHAQGRRYVRAHRVRAHTVMVLVRAINWDACMCVYLDGRRALAIGSHACRPRSDYTPAHTAQRYDYVKLDADAANDERAAGVAELLDGLAAAARAAAAAAHRLLPRRDRRPERVAPLLQ